MKEIGKIFIMTVALMTIGACATEDSSSLENEAPPTQEEPADLENQEETTNPIEENDSEEQAPPDFEPQIEETIEIEGMEAPIVLDLYENDEAPFVTYVPTDLLAEEGNKDEGDSYIFYANYEGEKTEEINFKVHLFPENITEEPSPEDDESAFAEMVADMEPVVAEREWYNWSLSEYQTEDGSDYVMLGEHNDQYFTMSIESEPVYSGGFIPRVHKIIEHFYWTDTQEYLVQ